jgi:hypothetical protein
VAVILTIVIVVLYGAVYSYPVGIRLWTRKGVSQRIWRLSTRAFLLLQIYHFIPPTTWIWYLFRLTYAYTFLTPWVLIFLWSTVVSWWVIDAGMPYSFFLRFILNPHASCRIWGSHSCGHDELYLPGYNAVLSSENQPTFRRKISFPSSGLKSKSSKKPARSKKQAELCSPLLTFRILSLRTSWSTVRKLIDHGININRNRKTYSLRQMTHHFQGRVTLQ